MFSAISTFASKMAQRDDSSIVVSNVHDGKYIERLSLRIELKINDIPHRRRWSQKRIIKRPKRTTTKRSATAFNIVVYILFSWVDLNNHRKIFAHILCSPQSPPLPSQLCSFYVESTSSLYFATRAYIHSELLSPTSHSIILICDSLHIHVYRFNRSKAFTTPSCPYCYWPNNNLQAHRHTGTHRPNTQVPLIRVSCIDVEENYAVEMSTMALYPLLSFWSQTTTVFYCKVI